MHVQGHAGWQQQGPSRCRATLTGARQVTLRSVDVDDMQAFLQQGASAPPSDFQREPDSLRMCVLSRPISNPFICLIVCQSSLNTC